MSHARLYRLLSVDLHAATLIYQSVDMHNSTSVALDLGKATPTN